MATESLEIPRIGVGVFVIKDGKFLMGQRVGSHGTGTWSVPGGWLEYKESFEDAAIREIAEETGLTIANVQPLTLTNNIFENEHVHSLTAWLTCDWSGGEPQLNEPDKFVGHDWFDLDTLPEPLFMPWKHLLQDKRLQELKDLLEKSRS